MFCYQCEQTAKGSGCTIGGVCGKDVRTAALQDLLIHYCKQIAQATVPQESTPQECPVERNEKLDRFLLDALFTTVTNVNFDEQRVAQMILKAKKILKKLSGEDASCSCSCSCSGPQAEIPKGEIDELVKDGEHHSIAKRRELVGPTIAGLQELILYGLKGAAAYSHHAAVLGKTDPAHYAEYFRTLAFLGGNPTDIETLLEEAMHVGRINHRAMELLDQANTETYGKPEPTPVRITPVQGKCIVVSGHDLKDLHDLLVQTEGRGINVYTHGEMLPCNAYPGLKKFKHLVGNYGGAWQDQHKEFGAFPGAILMTTNCIQRPLDAYKNRIFTTGLVAFPGVAHIPMKEDGTKDFTPVIEAALAAPGFTQTEPEKTILTGFAADAVLSVAGKVVDAVKSGALKHFFLIGGCDGAKPGRNYYTDLAQAVPSDCVILTLACGKYRFNKLEFGDIGGIPRLLDVGQCNDAYSAVRIALALADAFQCGVNDLPLSLVLSWYEQKAVAILLTLLMLGVRNIRLGPTLPAFVTPEVLDVLVNQFGIKPTGDAAEDLKSILGK